MKKKIIGTIIFVMLSISTITSLAFGSNIIQKEKLNTSILQEDIIMTIYNSPLFLGFNLDIENNGVTTINNVEWSIRTKASISGTGVLIRELLQKGFIDEIESGEKITLKFRPLNFQTRSPIGLGNIYINASAELDGKSFRTQQRAMIISLFFVIFRNTYMDIKPNEAYEKWQNQEFDLIIDVVGLDIYSLGHLPGAVNYVWADGTLNSKIPELDPSWTYLVYCHTDPPSTASAQALIDAGITNVYRLEGNFIAWKNAGYPIET
jgi:rhodanese-related sulfurtransferase